jgi:hypothetical protein
MPIRIPVFYTDLFEDRPGEAKLNELLAPYQKATTFRLLAMLNTLLSFYDKDEENGHRVQHLLFANLTNEELYERIQNKFKTDSMTRHPIFHRQQLLALMKRLLLKQGDGELDPNSDTEARYQLGLACLMQNDLLNTEEQNKKLEEAKADGEEGVLSELFAQLIVSAELLNPAEVLHAIVRSDEFFNILERRSEEFRFSNGETVLDRFRRITGLELRRYLWMIFGLCIVYKAHSEDLQGLIENPGKFNISKSVAFANTDLSQEEINLFFDQTAADLPKITEELSNPKGRVPLVSDYDLLAFRTYPLYYVDDERNVVSTIDFTFLTEKLSAGVFYTIANSIRTETNKDWHPFSGFWGNVFDEYVNDRLRDYFPLSLQRFYANPFFDKANEEAFDGVIDYGNSLVVMEHKGTYLTLDAKYSGQLEELMKGLSLNIGKGVVQIADKLEATFKSGEHDTFSQRGEVAYTFRDEDIKRVRKIYPVIIVQDFALQIGLANYKLKQELKREMERRTLREGITVMPLSLLTIEDVEKVIPYLNEFSLTDILDEYVSPRQEPLYTFENVLTRFLNEREAEHRNNEWILARRQELNERIQQQFNLS